MPRKWNFCEQIIIITRQQINKDLPSQHVLSEEDFLMKKYCVIGARGGSKGIIDKNIQLINGKSLLRIAAEKA